MGEATIGLILGLLYALPAFIVGFLVAWRRYSPLRSVQPPIDLRLVTLLDGQQALVTPSTLTSRERQILEQMWKLTHSEEKG